jgi:hypothetical protein
MNSDEGVAASNSDCQNWEKSPSSKAFQNSDSEHRKS